MITIEIERQTAFSDGSTVYAVRLGLLVLPATDYDAAMALAEAIQSAINKYTTQVAEITVAFDASLIELIQGRGRGRP